jgi:CheY-like chemotaxis protein
MSSANGVNTTRPFETSGRTATKKRGPPPGTAQQWREFQPGPSKERGDCAQPPLPNSSASELFLRLYIVEDSPVILENLVAALEELAPAKVVGSAADEVTAVQWLCQDGNLCHLVIVDIFLKNGNGLGVLKSLKERGFRGKSVVLTNYATAEMKDRCVALGASCVFDKSNEVDELIAYCIRLSAAGGNTESG